MLPRSDLPEAGQGPLRRCHVEGQLSPARELALYKAGEVYCCRDIYCCYRNIDTAVYSLFREKFLLSVVYLFAEKSLMVGAIATHGQVYLIV